MPDAFPWTIAAACFAVALAATIKAVDAVRALTHVQKELEVAHAEIASLKKRVDEQKAATSDEFTRPLKYPKNHVG